MKSREKEFYELAGLELFNGNYKVGLWNMAFSSALGDDAKSRALYMKFRVEEMEAEATRSVQRRSTILNTELPEGLATPEFSAPQGNPIAEKTYQKSVATEFSSNMSNTKTETTNHKGIKYYFGMLLCYIGAIIFIINNLYLFYAVISFAYVKFGVVWAIISFLAFPLTIAFGPIYLCLYTNNWWLIVNFGLLMGFSSIIIGIGNRLTKPFKVKKESNNLVQPKIGDKEDAKIEIDTSTLPLHLNQSYPEPPTLPENFSSSKKTVYSIQDTKLDLIINIVLKIIISSVIFLIAIGFLFTAIDYLVSYFYPSSNSTPHAIATPSSAATPQQVDSTARKDSQSKSESFVLRVDTELTIRKAPSIDSEIIKTIPATVYVIQIRKDHADSKGLEWSLITIGPYTGWVPKSLLSKITKYQK